MDNDAERRGLIEAAFSRRASRARLEFCVTLDAAREALHDDTAGALFINREVFGEETDLFVSHIQAVRREVPVIVMTPLADDETVLRALRDGATDCVSADPACFADYPVIAERVMTRFEAAYEHAERSRAILRSQRQWVSIIDAITDYIFVLDADRVLVKVNNTFASAVGRHPRDIVGKKIGDVFSLDAPNEAAMQDVLETGTPRIYEKKIGDEIYQVSIFPLLEDNRPLTIHVMKEITEVRRLKDQLYHADKLASIGLLVSGVAHEINNPLTGTIAYTELLALRVADESVRAELKKILDSAERCKKIVDNLLTFSRQRTPSKSLETINDIIDRAIDLRSYWLKSNSITIERDYDAVSTVFVDAQQIQQVILNLLLNAEQALVDVKRSDARIRFSTRFDKASRRVVIRVSDNGPGIPQKIASKIFDPFFTTKPVGIGTGLGLSISHGIIIEHGGLIRFESAEGGGAAFVIELPTGAGALV